MKKDFLTLKELSAGELLGIIRKARAIKKQPEKYVSALKNKTLAMLFQKTSTRTRISFEAGMTQLGGHAIYLDWHTTNFTLGSLSDEIRCISRYADIIMARVYKHSDVQDMARHSEVPVINGLSDLHHPCQAVADLMTVQEKLKTFKNIKMAYIGDGNNVCNSLILTCRKLGVEIRVAAPKGYEPQEKPDLFTHDPKHAAKDADVIYTDTWVSMGQEKETQRRMGVFKPYQVNSQLLGKALFMHCLPAHRGFEVTNEVIDGPQSIVFDQAENRLHAQKAILLHLLEK